MTPQQRALMQRLLRKKGVETAAAEEIPRRPPGAGPAPLSFAQQRMWVLQRLTPESPFYNVPGAVRLTGTLRPQALSEALRLVVERHEVLRTSFPMRGAEPVQEVHPPAPVPLPLVDLDRLACSQKAAWSEFSRLARREAQQAFDVERGPVLRTRLVRLAAQDHVLLLTFHHIITDAWSNGIVLRELATAYAQTVRGAPIAATRGPGLQYGDFAAWQRQKLGKGQLGGDHENEAYRKQLDYWRQQLQPSDEERDAALDLPSDRPRPKRLSARGLRVPVVVPPTLQARLDDLGRQHKATRYMVILATFAALLHRLSEQTPITIGSPVANRGRAELEDLVGFFANTVALRLHLDAAASFATLLQHCREVAHGAFAHQDLPFEELVRELQPERDLSRNPLFQVMFVLQNAPPPTLPMEAHRDSQLQLSSLRLDPGTAKFDLLLDLDDEAERLRGALEISLDLYDPTTGRRWVEHLLRLMHGIADEPAAPLRRLPVLSPGQRQQLLQEWSGAAQTARSSDDAPEFLHDLFLRTAGRQPDVIAAVHGQRHLSYGELARRSATQSAERKATGYGPESMVPVELARGLEQLTAMLAALRSGGAYLPIDPTLPAERRAWMRQAPHLRRVAPHPDARSRMEPSEEVQPRSLAYIVFTSGSTGTPKGVALPHRALANLFRWHVDRSAVPRPRTLAFSALGFDAALHEAFTTWGAGGTLILLDEARRRDPVRVLQLCRLQAVQRWFLPFVALDTLARTAQRRPDLHPSALREVITAGEQLRVTASLRSLFAALPAGSVLENHYGPSETHVVSVERLPATEARHWPALPSIGRPVDGCLLRVVDRHWHLQPIGVPGELLIGGVALARGYLGQPGVTAERFRPDPWHDPRPHDTQPDDEQREASGRLYTSGDLVRQLADGRLQFLGRRDRQVKIRGFRVEPGEVEAALVALPGVRQAAVTVGSGGTGAGATSAEVHLVAYVVAAEPPTDEADANTWLDTLRADLREQLPEYLLPRTLVRLDELPLTSTGKLRRDALPTPPKASAARPARERDDEPEALGAATGSTLHALLRGLWAQVLELTPDEIGDTSDFFRLGGHSLAAVRLLARVHDLCGVELPLAALFEAPNPAALAARLQRQPQRDGDPALRPGLAGEHAVPSFAQRRLWLLHRRDPTDAAYHLPVALRLRGPLDVARLEQALTRVTKHQEALRTVFVEGCSAAPHGARSDGPCLHLLPPSPRPLPVIDVQRARTDSSEALELARRAMRRPFDLRREVPWRAFLLRLGTDDHVLVLVLHHIAGDGWSLTIWAREISAVYAGALPSRPAVQFADFAAWQRLRWLQADQGLDWWRGRLTPLPPRLRLPWDRPPSEATRDVTLGSATEAALLRLQLPSPEIEALRHLAHAQGVTLFLQLAAAWLLLLSRAAGQGHDGDVSVGMASGGRPRPELEALIGLFVETLVLRVQVDAGSVTDLLARVRRAWLDVHLHARVPLDLLVRELVPPEIRAERRHDASPLFQTLLTLQNTPTTRGDRAFDHLPGLQVAPWTADTATPPATPTRLPGVKADLVLSAQELGDGSLRLDLEYRRDRFDTTTGLRLLRQLRRLLVAFAAQPQAAVATLPWLDVGQRHQALVEWRQPLASAPRASGGRDIGGRFLRLASQSPDAIAIVDGKRTLSYGEVARRCEMRAREVRAGIDASGRAGEPIVAVTAARSAELIVELLAILRAGAAYLPIDPEWPEARRREVVAQTGAMWWTGTGRAKAPAPLQPTLAPDSQRLARAPRQANTPSTRTSVISTTETTRLAYLIATSGSTGAPKAVAVAQGAVLSLVDATPVLAIRPGDTVAQAASATFDAATYEIWGALLRGARLCLLPKPASLDPSRLAAELRRHRVDVLFLTTALLNSTVRAQVGTQHGSTFGRLRLLLFGGEAVDASVVRQLLACDAPQTLLHVYGPTENTTFSTWQRVTSVPPDAVTVPIGHALGDSGALVLDARFEPVPPGYPGQLFLDGGAAIDAGEGRLARSYHRRPALTAAAFLPHAWPDHPGARMYRSGDLVRRRADGAVEFLGRLDRQVKLRGLRIEPGEIEAALTSIDGVRQAAVEVRGDRLVAWVVRSDSTACDGTPPLDLRPLLAERLPSYMVPSTIQLLDALPLTSGGKVDRRTLARMDLAEPATSPATVIADAQDLDLMRTLWADLLGDTFSATHLDPDADFFALGGHSLLAADLMGRIRRAFGVDLPLAALFEAPTLAGLARRVRNGLGEAPVPPVTPTRREPATLPDGTPILDAAPLSFAQERAWARWQRLTPGERRTDAYYNIPQALQLRGRLDIERLHAALGASVERHEPLRTTFGVVRATVRQLIHPPTRPPLPLVDLQRLAPTTRAIEQARLLHRESQRAFDLETGPLLRAHLLRLGEAEHAFSLVLHHSVADGASLAVLTAELQGFYADAPTAAPTAAPAAAPAAAPTQTPSIRYADYARWQQSHRGGETLEANLAFWRQRLVGPHGPAPPLTLPYDRPPDANNAGDLRGDSVDIELPADLDEQLRRWSRELGVTPFMLLLSAYIAFLHRISQPLAQDLTVGVPAAGRDRAEIAGLVGFFVHVQVLRAEIGRIGETGSSPTFVQLVEHVRQRALEAQRFQDVPFPRLAAACAPKAESAKAAPPLFRVLFALQNLDLQTPRLAGLDAQPISTEGPPSGHRSATAEHAALPRRLAKFDLTLSLLPVATADGLRYAGQLEYRRAVFDRPTVQRLAAQFRVLVQAAFSAPHQRLSELPLLPAVTASHAGAPVIDRIQEDE